MVEPVNDENVSPARSNGTDAKSRSSLNFRRSTDEEPPEYKMSGMSRLDSWRNSARRLTNARQ